MVLLPFLFNFLRGNWKIVVAVLAALALGLLVWSWDQRGERIDALEIDLANAKKEAEVAKLAEQAVWMRMTDQAALVGGATRLTEEARNAPSTSNATVAPVLRDALAGIRRLRDEAARTGGRDAAPGAAGVPARP